MAKRKSNKPLPPLAMPSPLPIKLHPVVAPIARKQADLYQDVIGPWWESLGVKEMGTVWKIYINEVNFGSAITFPSFLRSPSRILITYHYLKNWFNHAQ